MVAGREKKRWGGGDAGGGGGEVVSCGDAGLLSGGRRLGRGGIRGGGAEGRLLGVLGSG